MTALLVRAALVLGLTAAAPGAKAARLVIWMVGDDKTPQVMPPAVAVLMAGSLLASLPAALRFLMFQKQFVAGLQAGATKG